MTKLTKSGYPNKRFKTSKSLEAREFAFWQRWGSLVGVAILGFLAGAILTKTIWDARHPNKTSPEAVRETIEIKPVVVEAKEPLSWNDAIRQVFPADEAGRMIRICLKESGRKYAINHNTNGTFDYSWCQINSCHKPKGMTNAEWKKNLDDPMYHAKQVRKIYLSQGWNAWVVFNRGLTN